MSLDLGFRASAGFAGHLLAKKIRKRPDPAGVVIEPPARAKFFSGFF